MNVYANANVNAILVVRGTMGMVVMRDGGEGIGKTKEGRGQSGCKLTCKCAECTFV